jgi:invasion protein IalB
MNSFRVSLAFAAALFAAPALAQQAPADQQQQGRAPQPTDVKVYGDWTVECYPVRSLAPCEMVEVRVNAQTQQRVLGIALAFAPSRDMHVLRVFAPLGVSLQNGLLVVTDTYKSTVLKFRNCSQGGCVIETAIDAATLSQLARATTGKVQVVSVDGRRLDYQFSMHGFNDARAAMETLARAKAAAAPEPAAPAAPAQ